MNLVRVAGRTIAIGGAVATLLYVVVVLVNGTRTALSSSSAEPTRSAAERASLVAQGRDIFRYDTFGDQAFWGGALQLHKALEGKAVGGVGSGVSPKVALAVGLKVDAAKIPRRVAAALRAGKVDLNSPKYQNVQERPLAERAPFGHIGLQAYSTGTPVEFRNIRIKVLKAGPNFSQDR